jgi:hypothetical protein
MIIVVSGPDEHKLIPALKTAGGEVSHIETPVTRERLMAADIDEAKMFVLTAVDDASAIPVAKEQNAGLQIVSYAENSLPEFARPQTDFAVDPALFPVELLAEELIE